MLKQLKKLQKKKILTLIKLLKFLKQVNSELYGQMIEVPKELLDHLEYCFNQVPNSDTTVEGHKRNIFIRNNKSLTYQQLCRIKNWFDNFDKDKYSAPYILNGGDYMRNWTQTTIDGLRRGTERGQFKDEIMPEDIPQDLIDNMGWLSNMNRSSKSHSSEVDGLKITESINRINKIIKKII